MLKNENIICVSSIDWDFIWQGHQEIMSTFAAHGNRVLFIENTGVRVPNLKDLPRLKKRFHNWFHSIKGIRKERENLYIYSPLILPFPYSKIARWINRSLLVSALERWVKSIGFSNPILWTFLPTGLILDIVRSVDSKIVVYYCIDNFSASSPVAKKIRVTEEQLLRRADLVFVTAKNLYDWCSRYNEDVHLFPFGVNIDVYEKASGGGRAGSPKDIASLRRPVVGYVGGIHKWIDFDLVESLAEEHPDKSFVFVGPLQRDVERLKKYPNVHFLGQKRYEDLPYYVSRFDICTIPYLITEYTKNVYPTKLNEYLTLGKAVISTAIPEVEAFNERNGEIVHVAKTKEDFSSLVGSLASKADSDAVRARRRTVAIEESSWAVKIEKMCGLIEKKIREKELEKSVHWKDNILKFYSQARRKVIPLVVALVLIYAVFFHTPFIWWVGEPLRLQDPLRKADAIAVFAGGVGESGKAGQGYEERVKYAIDLYNRGLSDRLIFSSGYGYAFQETAVMKALAVSLGIPPDRIILEDKAKDTYENVAFTARILGAHGWKSAIVVSSPYHMRRVAMVWKKNAPGTMLITAPIPESIFFGDRGKVALRHIQAIVHEYIGIVYYWLKGRI